jgi:mannose-1-phosphate guanylyltransferase
LTNQDDGGLGMTDGGHGNGAGSFWAVIPAGGAGTRLWPVSRAALPKFLLPLTSHRSLLQQTVDRLSPLAPPERTLVVCGPAHAAEVARQLPEVPTASVVVEPLPRGSGTAIGLAAALIARHDPQAIMGSFAADHAVTDQDAFLCSIRTAIEAAEDGWLVTIGLTPTRPETGYGYIERTEDVVRKSALGAAFRAARFVEKPDLKTAQGFLETGRFAWNASMFVWRVQTLLDEMKRLLPDLYDALRRIAAAWDTSEQENVLSSIWPELAEVTIDHGVMEHAEHVAVVPAAMGWSDIGDWHGLGELLQVDEHGNSGSGDRVSIDSQGSVVWSSTETIVTLLGVENVIVVHTGDALLIAHRDRAQDVRHIVSHLKDRGRSDLV